MPASGAPYAMVRRAVTLFEKVARLTFRNSRDVRDGVVLLTFMFGAAAFEAIGIGIVMPFVSLLAHPEIVGRYSALTWIRESSGVTSRAGLVAVFGALLAATFLLKNA